MTDGIEGFLRQERDKFDEFAINKSEIEPAQNTQDGQYKNINYRPSVSNPQSKSLRLWDRTAVASHNVNGLKGDTTKIIMLEEWGNTNHINIIGLSETNIEDKRKGQVCKLTGIYTTIKVFGQAAIPTKLKDQV